MAVDRLQPYAVYSLVKRSDAEPSDRILARALKRAVQKGQAHSWRGTPQGTAALKSYLSDVRDAEKDFSDAEEWFCWAAFERLIARRCCEVWLRRAAKRLHGESAELVLAAAERYGKAYEFYDRYCSEVHGRKPTPLSPRERARIPERIAVIAPLLERGISAETAGLGLLERAAAMV